MGDLPDYTRQVTIRYEGGFLGLEELAVRLGFPGVWNLKGNIILMEDFESELTEWADESTGTCTATRSSRHKFSGDWALKLYNPGGAGAIQSITRRYFQNPGSGKFAVFSRWCWTTGNVDNLIGVAISKGTTNYFAEVRYNLISPLTLYIYTTGGTYYEVDAALDVSPDDYAWFPVLLTFNLDTGYYDKLYFADQEYDISDVPMYSAELGGDVVASVYVGTGEEETEFTTYVDDIIIAKNVP